MIKILLKICLYLTLLLPPLIIARGLLFPFVSGKAYLFKLFVELSLLLYLFLILEDKKYLPNFKNPLTIALIGFSLGLIICGFLGVDVVHSFFSEIERCDGIIQYLHWVTYFLILSSVFRESRDWKIFGLCFVGLALFISLFGWAQLFSSNSKIFFYPKPRKRIEGTFGNPDYMPVFLIFALFFLTWSYLKFFKRNQKFKLNLRDSIFLIIFSFFLITFIFTQTRGAYFGLSCGFLLFVILFWRYYFKKYRSLGILFLVLIVFAFIFWGILLHYKNTNFVKENPVFKRLTIEFSFKKGSLAQRLRTWQVAFKVFKEKPIFGWGPENFFAGFNKYLDPHIPEAGEPWYDKVHNQYLQVLCEGGLFLFSLYLFLIASVFYLCFKLIKNENSKFLGIIFACFYFAYLAQAIFLFDTFPMYSGLFPFLALLCFETSSAKLLETEHQLSKKSFKILKNSFKAIISLLIIFVFIECVWLPYRSNQNLRIFIFYYGSLFNSSKISTSFLNQALIKSQKHLKKALAINSPFTLNDVRKRSAWTIISYSRFLNRIKNIPVFKTLYQEIIENLKKAKEKHPYDPQIYYLLAHLNWLKETVLGEAGGLKEAEKILKEGLKLSPQRPIYLIELAQVYINENNYQAAEKILNYYVNQVAPFSWRSYEMLGHFYYLKNDFQKAQKAYLTAIEKKWPFWKEKLRFERLALTLRKNNDWKRLKFCYEKYLEFHPQEALAWYNLAVVLKKLNQLQKAQEALKKALELNPNLIKSLKK